MPNPSPDDDHPDVLSLNHRELRVLIGQTDHFLVYNSSILNVDQNPQENSSG